MAEPKFEYVLVGDSLAEAKEQRNILTIAGLREHLDNDEAFKQGDGTFKHCHTYFERIFSDECLPNCKQRIPGVMTVGSNAGVPYFRRNRSCYETEHGGIECPTPSAPSSFANRFNSIHFQHQLLVKRNPHTGKQEAQHEMLLPTLTAEMWSTTQNYLQNPSVYQYQIIKRLLDKFGNVLSYAGNKSSEVRYNSPTRWSLSGDPKAKMKMQWRSEKLNVVLPSMIEPLWFEHVLSTRDHGVYAQCTNTRGNLRVDPESDSLLLYVPNANYIVEEQKETLLKIPGVSILNWKVGGTIESEMATIFQFDTRNGLNMLKKNYADKIRPVLYKMFAGSGNMFSALKKLPIDLMLKEASITMFHWDDHKASLGVVNDSEGGKVQLSSDANGDVLLGILFTQAKQRMRRTATLIAIDENDKTHFYAIDDHEKGVVWLKLQVNGYSRFVIKSSIEAQMNLLIEVDKNEKLGSMLGEPQIGHDCQPDPQLMSQMIQALAKAERYIDEDLLRGIESLQHKTGESIAKETIRWAFSKQSAQSDDGTVHGSALSRKARMAWYLLQANFLTDANSILAMGPINDMLRYMPEYVQLPPENQDERWSRWTSRDSFIDMEHHNRTGRNMLFSPLTFQELCQIYPRVTQDQFGQRWMNPDLGVENNIPLVRFDDGMHPLTSRTASTASIWLNELLHLADQGGWRPMSTFKWAGEDFHSFSWNGSMLNDSEPRIFNPRDYSDFKRLKDQPPSSLDRQKHALVPYFTKEGRKFRMIVKFSNLPIYGGGLDYGLFISEFDISGNEFRYFQFGGSDLKSGVPHWIRKGMDMSFKMGGLDLRYLFDPADPRYIERETLRALTVLDLQASNFEGLTTTHWGRKGLSGSVYSAFVKEEHDTNVTFSPPYREASGHLKKRLLARNWWKLA